MQNKNSRRTGNRRVPFSRWLGIVLWAAAASWFLFPPSPAIVEHFFSRGWYRFLLRWMTPLTQSFRFPVIPYLVLAGCLCLVLFWAKNWIRIRRIELRSHWAGFSWGLRCAFWVIPILLIWFVAFWAAGYRRLPVEKRLRLDTSAISGEEMIRFRRLLLEQVNNNVPLTHGREEGRAVSSIASTMARIVARWDDRPIDLPGRVKFLPAGLLLFNGTSGMCAPFTLEALVDKGLPDTAIVYSAAHELGHIAGFCAEDEASFVGYVSGLQADDGFARYACALSAYMDTISYLSQDDFRKGWEALPEAAKQDVRKVDEAYRKYRIGWFTRISWRAYNRYLKAQGVKEGVENYSHGITLLGYAWRNGLLGLR